MSGLMSRTDIVVRAALMALQHTAQRQNFPAHRLKAMRFKIDCQYEAQRDANMLRVAWSDPEGDNHRSMHIMLDRHVSNDPEVVSREIMMSIEQINLRGELFYFRLHQHFPDRIEAVNCTKEGMVTVVFKNGRSLRTNEADLDSTEFLATCGMVYDL